MSTTSKGDSNIYLEFDNCQRENYKVLLLLYLKFRVSGNFRVCALSVGYLRKGRSGNNLAE